MSETKRYYLGDKTLLRQKSIAVVGSRNMSEYGKEVVNWLVPCLVKKGYVVVSGMALGVDAEVHKACLEAGGKTVAVLASGVDVVSPKSNEWIYNRILAEGGLIVSEYANGTQPRAIQFLERNRLVADLSSGVVVVEGAKRSGTLVTAKFALELNKEVYAIPGRLNDVNSWTPNWLLSQGARMVTSIEDIIDVT